MAGSPPPFETTMAAGAEDDLSRWPEARAGTDAVLMRAADHVRELLDMGEEAAIDVFGEREQLTLRLSLLPPNSVRIERAEPGGIAPEDAYKV